MTSPDQYFRAGVGAVVLDDDGLVLALERSDVPGAWQLPQGGIEDHEQPVEAMFRELSEETGLRPDSLRLLDRFPGILTYELPEAARLAKTGRGQAQYWFFLRLESDRDRTRIVPGAEFTRYRWIPFSEICDQAVEFRRPVYEALRDYLSTLKEGLAAPRS